MDVQGAPMSCPPISSGMAGNPYPRGAFAILDDGSGGDMDTLFPRLVRTQSFQGLTREAADEVVALLATPFASRERRVKLALRSWTAAELPPGQRGQR